jgi:hypothetical protein
MDNGVSARRLDDAETMKAIDSDSDTSENISSSLTTDLSRKGVRKHWSRLDGNSQNRQRDH